MQAVILMAGKGKRMAKYYEGPKVLLPVNGKPVVEYLIESLPAEVTELIFVVGGPHEGLIRERFSSGQYGGPPRGRGSPAGGRPITFVLQEEQLGLAHAYRVAQDLIKGRWYGMVGDDIIGAKGLKELAAHELSVLAYHVPNPEQFGVLVADEAGYLVRAVEKPPEFVSDLAWTGHMVMDESFFEVKTERSARGEYETPDVWTKMIAERGAKIKVVESELWLPINNKAQLEEAERALRKL